MRDWLLVADYVSGALDGAVGFAGRGAVAYAAGRDPAVADVLAVSTGSRAGAAPPATADEAIRPADVERLFVKIDSTLRGWPVAHVRTALSAWHPGATAVVCPAAPALGRTVRGGRLLVHGQPAVASAAGADPVAPATEDRLPVLFDAPLVAVDDVPGLVGTGPALVVDAVDEADLDRLAAVVESCGPRAVPVGAVGLAAALGARRGARAQERPRATAPVVLVTSLHPVATAQLATLGYLVPVVRPPATPDTRLDHAAATAAARAAARVAASLVTTHGADAVVVIGGDGTDALLGALGADGVEVRGSVLPGTPWGRVRGGDADGLLLVSRSGGFGGPDDLRRLIRILTEEIR
ncbi:four-carbon acid sugar kinase family protein [Amnibacterium endophyticum]|uniref:Four-carbon acid sugar kinase family protein n=1 Tax=Amnibacterium endophyticum TaxID=2109337 RepID=A0ABW4LGY6_9MICO